jgi:hypothetical protein
MGFVIRANRDPTVHVREKLDRRNKSENEGKKKIARKEERGED